MDVSFDDERHDFNRGNNSNETLTAINGAAAVIFIDIVVAKIPRGKY